MTKYFTNFLHGLIIASFVLLFSGCGYKADPVYVTPEQKIKNEQKREEQKQKKEQRQKERELREEQQAQQTEAIQK
jgi:predicted small lipoprotein YifL